MRNSQMIPNADLIRAVLDGNGEPIGVFVEDVE